MVIFCKIFVFCGGYSGLWQIRGFKIDLRIDLGFSEYFVWIYNFKGVALFLFFFFLVLFFLFLFLLCRLVFFLFVR